MQSLGEPVTRLGRLDDLVDESLGGGRLGAQVIVGVGLREPVALTFGISRRAQLAPVDDPDRRRGRS